MNPMPYTPRQVPGLIALYGRMAQRLASHPRQDEADHARHTMARIRRGLRCPLAALVTPPGRAGR